MNSRFFVIWTRMNHFETCLMILSQKSSLRTTQDGKLVSEFWWEKKKMATEIVQIVDFFLRNEFWHTGIQSPRFWKWALILNWLNEYC